ncbi:MAG: hypothetical protein RSB76_03335 [Clostridia bacterium]
MNNFTTKQMSDLIYDKLVELKDEVVLQNPSKESIFPCRVLQTPIESIRKTNNAMPVLKTFQIVIEHWCSKQRECMDMSNKTDEKLREYNLIRTNASQIIFDDITKKNRQIVTYEVRYNLLTNAFEVIK